MCGIYGVLDPSGAVTSGILEMGTAAIVSRGPDDAGVWLEQSRRVGLGHRRLAIVDLSSAGHQPMSSAAGRYTIVFNGEIYNHLELRRLIQGCRPETRWHGGSDTETLLAGFETWGIRETIVKSVGMFALAVWDRQELQLTLVRDRVGEKPLYYGWQGKGSHAVFLFGSELKALRTHPAFRGEIDRDALCAYLRRNCIRSPRSIYKEISKVPPAAIVTVSLRDPEPRVAEYWSMLAAATCGEQKPFTGSANEAVEALEARLRQSLRLQMVADVPLGAFLSGGVDSSVVVALMQSESSRPVRTFSIGFSEAGFNEAEHARKVAHHLGTDHEELVVTAEDALAVIPRLAQIYDEPFSDSSQIPTYLVAKLARKRVTVSLSGDAGDELFAGYNRYQMIAGAWTHVSRIPRGIRTAGAMTLRAFPPSVWDNCGRLANRLSLGKLGVATLGNKIHKASRVITCATADAVYEQLTSHWNPSEEVVIDGNEPNARWGFSAHELRDLDPVSRMMFVDMMTYLPDDILTKVDRAAMAVSLETRVPFLDHRLIEFAWRLPLSYKLRSGQTKWVLRQLLYKYVPPQLIDRPKMGFAIPLDKWLRGPLRHWAEDLLDEGKLRREGFFHSAPIRRKWSEHLSGRRNWQDDLWDVLMFQSWLSTH